ncbi:MAG: hypothetical protein KAS73_04285 [Candidatus Sabulitectum sp.]|nr:hypothetical protein [Candidatus Sabulitectum sp.]
MKSCKFALASSDGIELTSKHFGDSELFVLGEILDDGTVNITKQIKNEFRNVDETTAHGSTEKRQSIISYLGKDIDFIIAGQMSPNFKKINMKTKVCPIVSEITDIQQLLTHLKSNLDVLQQLKKEKEKNGTPDILRIGNSPV